MTMLENDDIRERFSPWDYLVFVIMLLLSASIGVFYGYIDRNKGTKEFLMAGKSMGIIPVALSMTASFLSAIILLAMTSEVYQNGVIFHLAGIAYILVIFATVFLYLPVFWDLQLLSVYDYLEKRFNKSVRMLGSTIMIFQTLFYMSVAFYAPSLALSQVTGISVYVSVASISFVCILYTTLGGMKAVLWADVLQVFVMYGSILFIVIKGAMNEGGLQRVWDVSSQGNRTKLVDWDFDPRTRHTFFSLVFGGYFTWISIYGVGQAQVQRYLCLPKKASVIRALFLNLILILILHYALCIGGLVIYTKYVDCDPVSSGRVQKPDQLLPLFVMESFGHLKGLPGLFVAGVFAGSLSTVSSGINALAAITLEDFIKAIWPNIKERKATIVTKVMSFAYGLIIFLLIFVIEQLGDLLKVTLGIVGSIGGPILGVFSLGMFFPSANAKGAFVGIIAGLSLNIWVTIGTQFAVSRGEITSHKLPLNTCDLKLINGSFIFENSSVLDYPVITERSEEGDIAIEFYKISYILYSSLGCLTTILVGLFVSLLTGMQNLRKLNPKLLSPAVSWFKWFIPGYHLIGIDRQEDDELLEKVMKSNQIEFNGRFIIAEEDPFIKKDMNP